MDLLYTELVSQQTHSYHKINVIFIGRPATPIFGELISGPSAGEVTIMIKTMASGLDDPSQVFWFVITPYTDSTKGETIPHLIPNYQSGTCAMIIVSGLEQGESYRFNATATNTFGVSEVAISNFITAGVGVYMYGTVFMHACLFAL